MVSMVGCVSPQPRDDGGADSSESGSLDDTGSAADTSDDGDDTEGHADGPRKVDVLFVIDDSATMGAAQGNIARAAGPFADALAEEGFDLRIAVTTTDNGNPWCGISTQRAGQLEVSSCRERLADFSAQLLDPAIDATGSCTSNCELDDIPLVATTTAQDPNAVVRPWIESGPAGTNLGDVDLSAAVRCALPPGVVGCGFEQPLESMRRSLELSATAGAPEHGFVRDDAHLVVVIVSDETDCSYADERIFLPEDDGGSRVYWSDPEASAPTSAVCWNAGVTCSGGPGVYEHCRASDRDLAGQIDVDAPSAVLHPLARYADVLAALHEQKQATSGASVMLFGIAGVPADYPEVPLQYADAIDPMVQSDFGVAPSCIGEGTAGIPPVRLLGLTDALAGPTALHSICTTDQAPAMNAIVAALLSEVGE